MPNPDDTVILRIDDWTPAVDQIDRIRLLAIRAGCDSAEMLDRLIRMGWDIWMGEA